MVTPDTETGSLITRSGMCSPIADTMILLSCIVLIALTYRLRARNLHNRGNVKRGAPPREEHLKSGRRAELTSKIFGLAARVSTPAVSRLLHVAPSVCRFSTREARVGELRRRATPTMTN